MSSMPIFKLYPPHLSCTVMPPGDWWQVKCRVCRQSTGRTSTNIKGSRRGRLAAFLRQHRRCGATVGKKP